MHLEAQQQQQQQHNAKREKNNIENGTQTNCWWKEARRGVRQATNAGASAVPAPAGPLGWRQNG